MLEILQMLANSEYSDDLIVFLKASQNGFKGKLDSMLRVNQSHFQGDIKEAAIAYHRKAIDGIDGKIARHLLRLKTPI